MSWSLVYFLLAQHLNNFTQMPMSINSSKGKNEMLHAEIFSPFVRSDVFLLQFSFSSYIYYWMLWILFSYSSRKFCRALKHRKHWKTIQLPWTAQNSSHLIKQQKWAGIWILEVSNTHGQEGARLSELTRGGSWSYFSQYDIYWSIYFLLFPVDP